MSNTKQQVKLDEEWVDLILTALEIGLPVEEIRNFLKDVKQA
ncbi:anti-repressor SinI family protein [Bacillus sp. SM2101]|nr:anti-repressor SinI family protein [Bacillus sp. SM2101]